MRRMVVRVLILCLISIDASVVVTRGEDSDRTSTGRVKLANTLESVQKNIRDPMDTQNLRSMLVSLRGVLQHLLSCNCCGKDRCGCCRDRGPNKREVLRDASSGLDKKDTAQSLAEDVDAFTPVEQYDSVSHEESHRVEEDGRVQSVSGKDGEIEGRHVEEERNEEEGDERVLPEDEAIVDEDEALRMQDLFEKSTNDCTEIEGYNLGDGVRKTITKAETMFSLPNVLVLRLVKRVSYQHTSSKYFAKNGIQKQLDLKQLNNDETCRFELVSYVRWSGQAQAFDSRGHYTAGVKRNGEWYLMNDDSSTKKKGDPNLEDNRKTAILFVYEKRQCASDPSELDDVEDARDENEPRGLRNMGNTCWFNALMQALTSSKIFREDLFATTELASGYGDFVRDLKKIVTYLYPRSETEVNQDDLYKEGLYKGVRRRIVFISHTPYSKSIRSNTQVIEKFGVELNVQQDSEEMFRKLLHMLHIGTATFGSTGSTSLIGGFDELEDGQTLNRVEFSTHERTAERKRYETAMKEIFFQKMHSMESDEPISNTKICQGQSRIADNFLSLSLEFVALEKPNVESPHFMPKCLERGKDEEPRIVRERFLCNEFIFLYP